MAVKNKIKKPKIYEVDGLHFKTKPLHDFYVELKEHKEQGLVNSFHLPSMQEDKAKADKAKAEGKKKPKNKFGAKQCEVDGHIFDSIMEAKYYVYLLIEKKNGSVKEFELQPKYVLQDSFKKNGKTVRAITYISDFLVTYKDGSQIVYDVKGRKTADFKLKEKMFDCRYRDITLICIQYRAKTKDWLSLESIEAERKKNKKAKGAKTA